MNTHFTNWYADISTAVIPTFIDQKQTFNIENRPKTETPIPKRSKLKPTTIDKVKYIPIGEGSYSSDDKEEEGSLDITDSDEVTGEHEEELIDTSDSGELDLPAEGLFKRESSFNPFPHSRSTNSVTFANNTIDERYIEYFVKYQQPAREEAKQKRLKKAIKETSIVAGSIAVLSDSSSEEEVVVPAGVSKGSINSISDESSDEDLHVQSFSKNSQTLQYILKENMRKKIAQKEPLPTEAIRTNVLMSDPQSILSIDIGIKNLGYTVITYKEPVYTLEDIDIMFGVCNISDNVGGSSNVIASRCSALFEFFSELMYKHNITRIIIEKQVPTNVKAMELMYAIYGMATILLCTTDPNVLVIYDPKLKFTTLHVPYNTKNKAHKRQSIAYATKLFDTVFKEGKQKFAKHQKKDDISDALNQAIIWMVDNGIFENMNIDDLRVCYGIISPKHTVNATLGSCEAIATANEEEQCIEDDDNWETISPQ